MTQDKLKAPDNHPDPLRWWRHLRWQSWIALAGLITQAPVLIYYGLPDAATAPLVVIDLGLVGIAVSYSGGSVVVDAITAWRKQGV